MPPRKKKPRQITINIRTKHIKVFAWMVVTFSGAYLLLVFVHISEAQKVGIEGLGTVMMGKLGEIIHND